MERILLDLEEMKIIETVLNREINEIHEALKKELLAASVANIVNERLAKIDKLSCYFKQKIYNIEKNMCGKTK